MLAAAACVRQRSCSCSSMQHAGGQPAPQTALTTLSLLSPAPKPSALLPYLPAPLPACCHAWLLPCLPAPLPACPALQNDLMQRELDHMSELAARQEQQLK